MNDDFDDVSESGDDQVIGTVFRYSIVVIVLLSVLATAIWWWLSRAPQLQSIEETVVQSPVQPVETSAAQVPRVSFTNISSEVGITFSHFNGAYGERLLPETMGSGVAIFDVNNDGHQDLFFANGTRWSWREQDSTGRQAMYVNRGDGTFLDVTEEFGLDLDIYGTGVAVGDVNGDGFVDLFLAAVGSNRLFLNQSGKGFLPGDDSVSGKTETWSTSAAFFDFDNDGDLDLFVCNYVRWSREIDLQVDYQLTGIGRAYGPPTNYRGTYSTLLRNDGSGVFTDVSQSQGIQVTNPVSGEPMGKALAVLPRDLDDDGWIDLVVANDTVQNFLFRNLQGRGFEEIGTNSGIAFDNTGSATGAMGVDAAVDRQSESVVVAIGNFANEMTSFYVSKTGALLFADEAVVSGIGPASRRALSFGLFFFDYDLDGRLDYLQTNGHVENDINQVQPSQHYEQPTQLFWHCGDECIRPYLSVPTDTLAHLSHPVVGRGAAYGDLDNDGDLDVVITQVARPPLVLRNDQNLGHNYLRVQLRGLDGNTGALGAIVQARIRDRFVERRVMSSRSYLSQMELPVTFGLGREVVDELIVHWPNGERQSISSPKLNQTLTITQQ